MDESIRDLLVRGIAAAKVNEKIEARFYLEWALRLDPPLDQRVEALFWLSEACDDSREKRGYLEEVLAYQPGHQPARRSLAILDGRLDPGEIVDPDILPAEKSADSQPLQSISFTCPQCGGRMVFQPDGLSLTCEYCESGRQIIRQAGRETGRDFTVAMATARGHTHPVDTRSFECKACGAVFQLSPQVISLTCPYCESVYVIESAENRATIPPDLLIPFSLDRSQAHILLSDWIKANDLEKVPARLYGIYLPVWHFTLSGRWPDTEKDQQKNERLLSYHRDIFLLKDVIIPASTSIPGIKADFFQHFDLKHAAPYDPAYLADWPAETYQISLSDASLQARWQLIEQLNAESGLTIRSSNGSQGTTSMDLLVQSYQLILVPAWIAHLNNQGQPLKLVVNGQDGKIFTDQPLRSGWLSRLLSLD
jgi:Zn finger protein HypA/HybF involved in hydrogenase expression